ncbi:unnamed protein product [Cyprideis torosa]|uniref:Uncharacterized protein n=1 Tax=Cyprideis torosa TaxID=163714 RepID=A0A7R8ZNT3_9CRUS|nr:unnamed protein product [Cyprideis torosa]CAG0888402.1 unnamed protein product [Cyprideis torosa]
MMLSRINVTLSHTTLVFFPGIVYVGGVVDREQVSKIVADVVAADQGSPPRHGSTKIEIKVLDINDNSPVFHNYDEVVQDGSSFFPIYRAVVRENNQPGRHIVSVYANDSDSLENGNGMVLYRLEGEERLFQIDTKNGSISTTRSLDFEVQSEYTLRVVAYDLGKADTRRSSTAIVVINVANEPESVEGGFFEEHEYRVKVKENVVSGGLPLLDLNLKPILTETDFEFVFKNETESSDLNKHFRLDPNDGTLWLVRPLDREAVSEVTLKVEAVPREQQQKGQRLKRDPGQGEVKVNVTVEDRNDNSPEFFQMNIPLVAKVPVDAPAGYHVIMVQATDPDVGINGEVRYSLHGKDEMGRSFFDIDPYSGQIRTVIPLEQALSPRGSETVGLNFLPKVFRLNVRATDMAGADGGNSVSVTVYITVVERDDDTIMTLAAPHVEIENDLSGILRNITLASGIAVQPRKLTPHVEDGDVARRSATDLFLFGVDPRSNNILDSPRLMKILEAKMEDISNSLVDVQILKLRSSGEILRRGVPGGPDDRLDQISVASPGQLRNVEVAMIIIGSIIFIASLITLVIVCNVRQHRKRSPPSASVPSTSSAAPNPWKRSPPSASVPSTSQTHHAPRLPSSHHRVWRPVGFSTSGLPSGHQGFVTAAGATPTNGLLVPATFSSSEETDVTPTDVGRSERNRSQASGVPPRDERGRRSRLSLQPVVHLNQPPDPQRRRLPSPPQSGDHRRGSSTPSSHFRTPHQSRLSNSSVSPMQDSLTEIQQQPQLPPRVPPKPVCGHCAKKVSKKHRRDLVLGVGSESDSEGRAGSRDRFLYDSTRKEDLASNVGSAFFRFRKTLKIVPANNSLKL